VLISSLTSVEQEGTGLRLHFDEDSTD